jgi:adenylate kinase family enzyme
MRIVVAGTSGSGKTTLARRISRQLGLPLVELDEINWQANWHDISRHDPPLFIERVKQATEGERWVVDGNYSMVRAHLWQRATHVIWLDYDLPVVMARVITRTFIRLVMRTPLWAGNRERWHTILDPDHPIRWAWSTHGRRRRATLELAQKPEYAGLTILRLRRPREAEAVMEALRHGSADIVQVRSAHFAE